MMSDLRDRIKADESPFQQLLEAIPGFDGYREREIRRTADKLLREHLVTRVDRVRADLRQTTAEWARAGRLSELDDIDRLSRLLDKARDNIRFADYGYTGFFDAVKVREEQLDKLYEHDRSLQQQIEACASAVTDLRAAGAEDAAEKMQAVEQAIGSLQQMVDRRGEVAADVVMSEE